MPRLFLLTGLLLPPLFAFAQQPTAPTSPDSTTHPLPPVESFGQSGIRPIKPHIPLLENLRQVAGVQVTPQSGAPGAPVVVRIRGAASLGSDVQPLYILDGLPVWQHQTAASQDIDGQNSFSKHFEFNPVLTLAPEDIQSIEVLKGAYATAEYGAQGQNGVIRITTHSGQAGKPRLSYSGLLGIQQARFRYDLLNATEYAGLVNAVDTKNGGQPTYSAEQLASLGTGTDWQDELLRTAVLHHQQVALQGGNSRNLYYTSAAYGQQQGILQNSRLRVVNLRTTVEHQFTPKLTLRGTALFSDQQATWPDNDLAASMVLAAPIQPTRTADGELAIPEYPQGNPLREALLTYRTPHQSYLLGQLHLRYKPHPSLTLELRGSREIVSQQLTATQTQRYTQPAGRFLTQKTDVGHWMVAPSIHFQPTLPEDHKVEASLSVQTQSQRQQLDYNRALNSGAAIFSGSVKRTLDAARLAGGYQFRKRYEVAFSLRADMVSELTASSTLYSPAAQVLWHVGNEPWLATVPAVSMLDFRMGLGHSSNAGDFSSSDFLVQAIFAGNGLIYRYFPLLESCQQLETGVKLGLWQDKITLDAEVYQRETYAKSRIPIMSLPNKSDIINFGQVHNTGLELTMTYRGQVGRLQSTTSLAAAFNRNRYQAADWKDYKTNLLQVFTDGASLSSFNTLHYLGSDSKGFPRYADNDQDGGISLQDKQLRGSGLPKQLFSLTQHLVVARFQGQAQIDGMFGYQQATSYLTYLNSPTAFYNSTRDALNYWTPTNTSTNVPAPGYSPTLTSDFALQSANHIRLTELSLSYKLWEQSNRSVRLMASAYNLFVLSKYRGFDPNVSSAGADTKQAGLDNGAYPTARTISLGVQAML